MFVLSNFSVDGIKIYISLKIFLLHYIVKDFLYNCGAKHVYLLSECNFSRAGDIKSRNIILFLNWTDSSFSILGKIS